MKYSALVLLPCLFVATACGGSSPPAPAAASVDTSAAAAPTGDDAGAPAQEPEVTTTRAICTGRDIDLSVSLIQSVCELKDEKDVKLRDVKGVLDIKAAISGAKVAPGSHVDVVVTYINKGNLPLPLDFMIDPVPRFSVEAYDSKGKKRVDLPRGEPPPPPKDATDRPSAQTGTARVILSPGGSARMKVEWDAVRTKWAPEKYKGTPLEMGYPRKASGPLPAGKYQLRVVTPLINVMEEPERDMRSLKLDIEVGK